MSEASTPLMRQYNGIKQQVPNALLMFRLGDFYELFFEDAVVAARELEITLTARNKEKGAAIPMCGVPYHAAEGYIARLIQKGYRVAICDQMEDPAPAKKLVKREITRIVTPGTATDANLRALPREQLPRRRLRATATAAGVAHVDVSTGEFRVTEIDPAEVAGALEQLGAREVLFPGRPAAARRRRRSRHRASSAPSSKTGSSPPITPTAPCAIISSCSRSMAAASPTAPPPSAPPAPSSTTSATPSAPRSTTSTAPPTTTAPTPWCSTPSPSAISNWSSRIFAADAGVPRRRPPSSASSTRPLTGMGGRLLRQRLLRPSLDRAEIEQRLDAVGELLPADHPARRTAQATAPASSISSACSPKSRSAPPARAICWRWAARSKRSPPSSAASTPSRPPACATSTTASTSLPDVANLILDAIADEPPLNLADGGTIRAGFHAELDELRDLSQNGRQYIAQIEARERQRTGIQSLKVRFNNVFGYYIEISNANLHLAPADYERKQTLVNAERFTTPELKDYERKVLDAEDKILDARKGALRRGPPERRRPRAAHPRHRRRHRRARCHRRAGPGGRREPLPAPALLRDRRDAHPGRPPSRDRAPRRTGSRPLHPQRSLPQRFAPT